MALFGTKRNFQRQRAALIGSVISEIETVCGGEAELLRPGYGGVRLVHFGDRPAQLAGSLTYCGLLILSGLVEDPPYVAGARRDAKPKGALRLLGSIDSVLGLEAAAFLAHAASHAAELEGDFKDSDHQLAVWVALSFPLSARAESWLEDAKETYELSTTRHAQARARATEAEPSNLSVDDFRAHCAQRVIATAWSRDATPSGGESSHLDADSLLADSHIQGWATFLSTRQLEIQRQVWRAAEAGRRMIADAIDQNS